MEQIMTKDRRQLLYKELKTWIKFLNLGDVLFCLQQASVIDDNVIKYVKGSQQPQYELIKQLERRGNNAFFHFYCALILTNQRSLAELLDQALSYNERLDHINCNFAVPTTSSQEGSSAYMRHPEAILGNFEIETIDGNAECRQETPYYFDEQKMYRNFSSPRGLALIISNCYFEQMGNRTGTDKDEVNLKNLFVELGYIVVPFKNLTAREMLEEIQNFAKRREHFRLDSCIVCVLTHGECNDLYGVDDNPVQVHQFISQLNASNCPALAFKPKIFILQACRGQRYDQGILCGTDSTDALGGGCFGCSKPKSDNSGTDSPKRLPIEADFLIAYATVPGYVAWRNGLRGSWFIQSICEIFSKFAGQTDILDMLTMVNQRVAETYESDRDRCKQMPECSTRLRKKFFFFPEFSGASGSGNSSITLARF